jgi:Rrf2 family protein
MQITRQADYALRAALYLAALAPGQKAATAEIAERQCIPPSFLAKIIAQLSIVGLIQTSRGARGGVSLSRPADQVSILEIVEAIDGPLSLNVCSDDPADCPCHEDCPLCDLWAESRAELAAKLGGAKLATYVTAFA